MFMRSLAEMSQLSFDHLLNLSFAFHLRRKTGEILRILDRGAAINRAFEVRVSHFALRCHDLSIYYSCFYSILSQRSWTLA